jgi:hypothetical protein
VIWSETFLEMESQLGIQVMMHGIWPGNFSSSQKENGSWSVLENQRVKGNPSEGNLETKILACCWVKLSPSLRTGPVMLNPVESEEMKEKPCHLTWIEDKYNFVVKTA